MLCGICVAVVYADMCMLGGRVVHVVYCVVCVMLFMVYVMACVMHNAVCSM